MRVHWLDTNIYIQAKNGPYGFDIVPSFWRWVETACDSGILRSPKSVCGELERQKDEVAAWARKMKKRGDLFISSDSSVQAIIGDIGVFVNKNYEGPAAVFMSGADPWVIAHACVTQGVVVTHETLGGYGCKSVKIPNVCSGLAVSVVGAYDAFRSLGMNI